MRIFHPSIFYIYHNVLLKLIYVNCIKNFGFRRLFFTVSFLLGYIVVLLLNIFFRLLDEVLYFGYRRTEINSPVFIISNPRSGTTLLHRLMCLDDSKFAYVRLYQTLIISISFYRLIHYISKLDGLTGSHMAKMVKKMSEWFFRGWKGIHAMGLNSSEEDEGIWFLAFASPSISLLTPFMKDFYGLNILDELDPGTKAKLMSYYVNSLKRIQYALGRDKRLLMKSVMSTGRIESYLSAFPDMKAVYIVRNPLETIPSYVSMFSKSWEMISPDALKSNQAFVELSQVPIDFRKHFDQFQHSNTRDSLHVIRYVDLIADTATIVRRVYKKLNLEFTHDYEKKLNKELSKTSNYTSKHSYSLEKYGLKLEDIVLKLMPARKYDSHAS